MSELVDRQVPGDSVLDPDARCVCGHRLCHHGVWYGVQEGCTEVLNCPCEEFQASTAASLDEIDKIIAEEAVDRQVPRDSVLSKTPVENLIQMPVEIAANIRFADGVAEKRKGDFEAPFQGDPLLEAYEESLDQMNYIAELEKQCVLGDPAIKVLLKQAGRNALSQAKLLQDMHWITPRLREEDRRGDAE